MPDQQAQNIAGNERPVGNTKEIFINTLNTINITKNNLRQNLHNLPFSVAKHQLRDLQNLELNAMLDMVGNKPEIIKDYKIDIGNGTLTDFYELLKYADRKTDYYNNIDIVNKVFNLSSAIYGHFAEKYAGLGVPKYKTDFLE